MNNTTQLRNAELGVRNGAQMKTANTPSEAMRMNLLGASRGLPAAGEATGAEIMVQMCEAKQRTRKPRVSRGLPSLPSPV